MSLRDQFAMAALVGIAASMTSDEVMKILSESASARGLQEEQYAAAMAYALADAMLSARETKQ